MSLASLRRSQAAILIAGAVTLAAAGSLLAFQLRPSTNGRAATDKAWVYDPAAAASTEDGSIPTDKLTPGTEADLRDGPRIGARVFACGSGADAERWVGYLSKFEGSREMVAAPAAEPQWVASDSEAGAQVIADGHGSCDNDETGQELAAP